VGDLSPEVDGFSEQVGLGGERNPQAWLDEVGGEADGKGGMGQDDC
jgi:hypothetical protein